MEKETIRMQTQLPVWPLTVISTLDTPPDHRGPRNIQQKMLTKSNTFFERNFFNADFTSLSPVNQI